MNLKLASLAALTALVGGASCGDAPSQVASSRSTPGPTASAAQAGAGDPSTPTPSTSPSPTPTQRATTKPSASPTPAFGGTHSHGDPVANPNCPTTAIKESKVPPAGIEVTLEVPKTTYRSHEPIEITIKVKNANPFPVKNQRPNGGPPARAWATFHEEEPRLQWISGLGTVTTQGVVDEEFAPLSETTHQIVWDRQMCSPEGSSSPYYSPPFRPNTPFKIQGHWNTMGGGWWTNVVTIQTQEGY